MTYMDLGLSEKAIALNTIALKNKVELLGTEHPSTLFTMAILAQAFKLHKSYDKAVPLSAQALEMRRKVLGSEHPDTLWSMNNFASMYHEQGLYDRAIELESEAFETRKRVSGSEHEDTLDIMAGLAVSLHAIDRRQSASNLMELCAANSLITLGTTDPVSVARQEVAEHWREELMESVGRDCHSLPV